LAPGEVARASLLPWTRNVTSPLALLLTRCAVTSGLLRATSGQEWEPGTERALVTLSLLLRPVRTVGAAPLLLARCPAPPSPLLNTEGACEPGRLRGGGAAGRGKPISNLPANDLKTKGAVSGTVRSIPLQSCWHLPRFTLFLALPVYSLMGKVKINKRDTLTRKEKMPEQFVTIPK
jgi:hypothetical protein